MKNFGGETYNEETSCRWDINVKIGLIYVRCQDIGWIRLPNGGLECLAAVNTLVCYHRGYKALKQCIR